MKHINKFNKKYIFYLIIIFIIIFILYNYLSSMWITFKKNMDYFYHKQFYNLLDTIKTENITINNIPHELKNYIKIFNVSLPNNVNKSEYILHLFFKKYPEFKKYQSNYKIIDELNFKGGYFPSIHTDIEWNKIKNNGVQFWYLEYNNNNNNIGNMFLFYNNFLYEKYKNQGICLYLDIKKNEIVVKKSCLIPFELERMSIENFKKYTKKYYLNITQGQCLMLKKNVLHMSDYRTLNNNRKSLNFRVVFKNKNGNIDKINDLCGFTKSLI